MSSCKARHHILITDKFKQRYLDFAVKSSFAASQKLPGPYEVVFYSETDDSPGLMLWRYPEPRVLTFVRITPVPFNTTEDPEISTADLGDVLQVCRSHTSLQLKSFLNVPITSILVNYVRGLEDKKKTGSFCLFLF